MRRVIRRALALAAVLALACCGSALAIVPAGPRLATVEMTETRNSPRLEDSTLPFMSLGTMDPNGDLRRRFARARLDAERRIVPFPFNGPVWSPDGGLIAFSGVSGKTERIFVASPDGSGLRALPGTRGATNPVFSPDGRTLAFARRRFRSYVDTKHITEPGKDRSRFYASRSTWIVDLASGGARRLTRWRNGLSNVPGAFAPDGSTLLVTKDDDNLEGPRIMSVRLDGGGMQEVVRFAEEPALSPDGTQLAFVGYLHPDLVEAEEGQSYHAGELYIMGKDGSPPRRLTRTDDVLESSPSWDPSGQRIAYVQVKADTSFLAGLALLFPVGNALVQVNADGSCRDKIVSDKKIAFYGVAWQPGPGREAGRIDC